MCNRRNILDISLHYLRQNFHLENTEQTSITRYLFDRWYIFELPQLGYTLYIIKSHKLRTINFSIIKETISRVTDKHFNFLTDEVNSDQLYHRGKNNPNENNGTFNKRQESKIIQKINNRKITRKDTTKSEFVCKVH